MSDQDDEMEESFEVLDIAGTSRGRFDPIFRQLMNHINEFLVKYPTTSRVVLGGTGGYLTGFVFKKVGKAAASAVGGGLLLLQIAHKAGYITVNTNRVNNDVRNLEERVRSGVRRNESTIKNVVNRGEQFIRHNSPAAVGFAAGFLLGLSY